MTTELEYVRVRVSKERSDKRSKSVDSTTKRRRSTMAIITAEQKNGKASKVETQAPVIAEQAPKVEQVAAPATDTVTLSGDRAKAYFAMLEAQAKHKLYAEARQASIRLILKKYHSELVAEMKQRGFEVKGEV